MRDYVHCIFQLEEFRETISNILAKGKEFLEEDVGTAVDDHHHLQVVHLAKTISVCDFRQ